MMIIMCPYCCQYIKISDEEEARFKKDENPKCPRCNLSFMLTEEGSILEIGSERKKIGLPDSCCNKSLDY